MEQYSSNSKKSKEEKKVQKVITGTATLKKKTETKKILSLFSGGDMATVKNYIWNEILIPVAKNTLSEIVKGSIDIILFHGETPQNAKKTIASKISYNRFYEEPSGNYIPRRINNGFDYDDVEFDRRGDAEIVLSGLDDIINQFGVASVGDFYDLAQVSTDNFMVNNYGWKDLSNADVVRLRNGKYALKMPKAFPLN